eukprot:scaffold19818_cov63-Phaeocystis_antarctica.AAC.2
MHGAQDLHDRERAQYRVHVPSRRLNGQRRWDQRLWRRLARAPQAVAGRPVAEPRPGITEPIETARRALRRHRSRAGALPRVAL